MNIEEINENFGKEENLKKDEFNEMSNRDNENSNKNEEENNCNEEKLKSNLSSNFSNQNQNIRNNINSNTNDITNEETNKVNINNNSFQENDNDNKQKSDICINKLSSFNENLNQIDDDIINEENDKQIFENVKNNINNEQENSMNNEELISNENNKINLNNDINNDIFEKNDDKNELNIEDEDIENINDAVVDKEYSTENFEENNNSNEKEKNLEEDIKFDSNLNKENVNDENDNELLNYKNISDSEKAKNTNENKEENINHELKNEMIKKLITKKNDVEVLELYSFEGNENNNKNNENDNEEYFIDENIINFQNNNPINANNQSDKKNTFINENQNKKEDNKDDKKKDVQPNLNKKKKINGVIRANRFKLNSNNINPENKKNKIMFNEDILVEENDNNRKSEKDAMKKLQYLISQKESNNNANNNDSNNKISNKIIDDNINQIKSEKTKQLQLGVYKKNMKKIPYRKFLINTNNKEINKNNLELKLENTNKDNKHELNFEKYKTFDLKEKINNESTSKKPFQIDTNYANNNNNIKDQIEQYYKTAYIPYNNYINFFQKTSPKSKIIKNNLSKIEDNKTTSSKNPQRINDYSFDGVVYRKRTINNPDLSIPTTSRVYSKKRQTNPRRNTFGKYESNQNKNNYNENDSDKKQKKEKININPNQIYSPNSYIKKIPLSGQNRVKNNNYLIKINYINENNKYNKRNIEIGNYNNSFYNQNVNLFNSKTNINLENKMRTMNKYNNIDLSTDNMYQNKYIPTTNNINNTNSRIKENKYFNFYKRNRDIYNTMKNFQINNRINRFNQSLPFEQKNYIIKNNNFNNEHYYDEEQNNLNNNEQEKYYDNNYYKYNYNSDININIEDLIVLEEKLNEIIYFLKSKKEVKNQCYDFWNFLFYSSINKLEKTFKSDKVIQIIKLSINLELLSIMLIYEFSFDEIITHKTYILLLEILEINHTNLIHICQLILNKVNQENSKSSFIQILYRIISSSINENEKYSYKTVPFYEKINLNNDKLIKKIRNILYNYQTEFSPLILSLSKKINNKTYEQINDFFQEYILRKENEFNDKGPNAIQVRPPFILSKRKKKFTLILSLDETLIHLQQINYNQCSLKLRPYLIEFLESVKPYYELILFTTKSKYYTIPVMNVIHRNKKYFDFIFYKEHCIIIGNTYVKDLTRIGRSLDSTIIVDNLPQHFKLQKENGINIKSFWAQDPNDRALYDLIPILMNIAFEETDVREGLEKYREEIVGRITSNIFNS